MSLGLAVFAAGLLTLGLWLGPRQAAVVQHRLAQQANGVLLTAVHGMTGQVTGRDIRVTGIADGVAEERRILQALADLPGHRQTSADLVVVPTADPFTIAATKTAVGITWQGHVPTEPARRRIAHQIGLAQSGALTLAAGAPQGDWEQAVLDCHAALAHLEAGRFEMSDRTITVEGTARTPVEVHAAQAVLAALPYGYVATAQIDVLDDGTPFAARIAVTPAGAVWQGGKLPQGVRPARVAQTLNRALAGTPPAIAAISDQSGDWASALVSALRALSYLSRGQLDLTGGKLSLVGFATTPEDIARAEAELAVLPEGFLAVLNLEIEDDGRPFFLSLSKQAGEMRVAGKVPAAVSRRDLATWLPEGGQAENVIHSFTGPDQQVWRDAVRFGVSALAALEDGQVEIRASQVILKGLAQIPDHSDRAQALLARIPQDFAVMAEITLADDGLPFALHAEVTRGIVSLRGKVPASAAGVIGPADGAVQIARIGDALTEWPVAVEAVKSALPHLRDGVVRLSGDRLTVSGTVATPDQDMKLRDALAHVPPRWHPAITVTPAPIAPFAR
ncbi:hypothetical protein [Actibacterium sp. 188UL27-1]|uniref:hypothetical protein n=1 Tax=Actibacterium sp. 188UL27-1 TaxID=2786961 RepID=UPI00195B6C43|nr:hypothetical protein [Actibacterium sp. 188UL27-1]MBM7067936.1 hypothetical protein [Actibacterium sp. 188UL27-1]